TEPISLDVRVIAATNANLEKAVMNKTFREDLYYRLTRLPITIPSLKERLADLPDLITRIIQKINQDYGRNVKQVSDEALKMLQSYPWPGNVRELENVIGRAIIYMDVSEEIIERKHLPELMNYVNTPSNGTFNLETGQPLQKAVEQYEKEYIKNVYEKNNFNKTKTAKSLNISIRSLYYKMEKYYIE